MTFDKPNEEVIAELKKIMPTWKAKGYITEEFETDVTYNILFNPEMFNTCNDFTIQKSYPFMAHIV